MENWRLRDMIWNFTLALKFPFIWPEYLAIVLFFLSQFNPFQNQLVTRFFTKETKLKIVRCDWPSVWECQHSELWSQRLQDISTRVFQPQTSTPDFSTINFSIMNTYFNQELFNHEHYNPEIFNHEHFNPWQLFIVKSGNEAVGWKVSVKNVHSWNFPRFKSLGLKIPGIEMHILQPFQRPKRPQLL